MGRQGATVAARARALVGTRFRPQGRRPEHGLDCVGLAGLAAGVPAAELPTGYQLRSEIGGLEADRVGEAAKIDVAEAGSGDILLVQAGPGQHHLLVLVEGGFVHADAGLGRVVERPGAVPWPILAAWRIGEA
ncbi:MAG TPA: peptidoglycan endopeptidase [Allosphingosinicella sp.]